MVNKLRRQRSPRLSRSILCPSPRRWRRGRGLKNNRAPRKATRESMHTISRGNERFIIIVFSCSLLSGTRQILASQISATALHRFTSQNSFCFRRVYKLTMSLDTVDSDTQPKKVPRQGRQGQSADSTSRWCPSHLAMTSTHRADAPLMPLPRCDDTPDARPTLRTFPRHCDVLPTPRSGRDGAAPAPCWRPSHAAMTPLPRPTHAAVTPLTPIPRSDDALPTPFPRCCDAPPTPRSGRDDVAPAPCWHPSHAAMTPLPRRADAPPHAARTPLTPLPCRDDARG